MTKQLSISKKQQDDIQKLASVWKEAGKNDFLRYRMAGQYAIKTGYKKGEWHSQLKEYFMEALNIGNTTFSYIIRFGEMTEAEFSSVAKKFSSIHEWALGTKTPGPPSYSKKILILYEAFDSKEEAETFFQKLGGKLDGPYWFGVVDKRLLKGEDIDEQKGLKSY